MGKVRQLRALFPLLALFVPTSALPAPLPPVATGDAPAARLLRQWWKAGTAAGNAGDFYDNRDANHSRLPLEEFPQLEPLPGRAPGDTGYGPSQRIYPFVLLGNSSTAGHPAAGGTSNARLLESADQGLRFLATQYRGNQFFVYPEHADHDPGRDGPNGWGDLFPANTPYLVISQGSSRSDLPFLQAAAWTLAAFPPATKKRLVETGLLMPALQMILRRSGTQTPQPDDYFTWRAHPSAFDPARLDPVRMVNLAHSITPEILPPLAQMRVVTEDTARPGVDAFDADWPEKLADTPGAIARVWRSTQGTRRMVISADASFDADGRPLTFRWVVTRGSPEQVTVRTLDDRGAIAELIFHWTPRHPVGPGESLESNRLDVALFVSNGTWWSAPAFVTWYSGDRELRTYGPAGQLVDIDYATGGFTAGLEALTPVFDWLQSIPASPTAEAFRALAGDDVVARVMADEFVVRAAEEPWLAARSALALAPADQRATATAAISATEAAAKLAGARGRAALLESVRRWLDDPNFATRHEDILLPLLESAPAESRDRLAVTTSNIVLRGLARQANHPWRFIPGDGRTTFTAAESAALIHLNVALLVELLALPGLRCEFAFHSAGDALCPRKPWRDVYRHDASGRRLGWRRYADGAPRDYTAEGLLVVTRDDRGRPREARSRVYKVDAGRILEQEGGRRYTYAYTRPDDLLGRPIENP